MKKVIAIAGLLAFPAAAFAQVDLTNLGNAIQSLTGIINILIPFFIAIAVLVFIYGLIKYVLQAGNAEARVEARGYIIYGIIGIVVMLSVFGLVNLVQNTFFPNGNTNKLNNGQIPSVPCVNGNGTITDCPSSSSN
jgi:Type IV secretion system pilin